MSNVHDLFDKLEAEVSPDAAKKRVAKRGRKDATAEDGYTAADIEVLEGLEPVRRRPGMYIGGTDEKALHHLFAEVIDNSMDEAVAGHASFIEVEYDADGWLTVSDNGRGIPIDPHPKFKDKTALEVIMTTLHAGGKFDSKVYETSGGLHGVGVSVVNALAETLEVEVARNQKLYRQCFARGVPQNGLEDLGKVHNRRGTRVRFKPDAEIFGKGAAFKPSRLYRMARSKAYLFGGVEIRWQCDPALIGESDQTPAKATLHFPGGLKDYLADTIEGYDRVADDIFAGKITKPGGHGTVEWAIAWFGGRDGFINSYCNTVPTIEGGTHETGLRSALSRGLKAYGELSGNKRASIITADDAMSSAGIMLSVFIREPEFQGQTKEKLATTEATRIVENALRDHFDHWLTGHPRQADKLLEWIVDRAEDRSAGVRNAKSTARPRYANCACPANSPTVRRTRRQARNSLSSRETRPEDQPSRLANASLRRSCPCAARSSMSPRPPAPRSPRTSRSPTSSRRWVAARARSTATRTCDTRRSSS